MLNQSFGNNVDNIIMKCVKKDDTEEKNTEVEKKYDW